AAQNKKTVERPGDRTHRILEERNLISELLVFSNDDDTAHQIGVAVQIFGCRMHNDIKPRFDRSLDPWSSERIIANGNQFLFACDLSDRVKIDQFEQRIARG